MKNMSDVTSNQRGSDSLGAFGYPLPRCQAA